MKILFFANTDWYLYNFRLGLARFLGRCGHEVVMVSPPGSHGPRLEAEGFRWIPLDMQRRSLNPLREARLVLRLIKLYREERPDLVHHFTLKCVIYGAIAARIANVRAVIHAIAGFGFVFVSDTLLALALRPFVRRMLRAACSQRGSAIIVQNSDDLAAVRRLSIGNTPVHLIRGSGVDVDRFKPRTAPRPDGPLNVLFVGRLLIDKGIEDFVSAASMCQALIPGKLKFLAAGEPDFGNPASVPPERLSTWRDGGTVDFLGHVEDMAMLLSSADIVVLPSYGEGAPRSLIEAAACAIPLVATDVRGCREVVVDGHNGYLVPLRDVDALVHAIVQLAEDPALRERMGNAGRRRVLDELQERTVVDKTYQVYQQVLTAPRRLEAGGGAIPS